MNEIGQPPFGVMPRLVLALIVVLILGGIFLYGIDTQVLERLWRQLLDRPSGPLKFRFILQPAMAILAAIHDGRQDARTGRLPYLQAVMNHPLERVGRLREGLTATARIILLGLVMDMIYQVLEFGRFYPDEAVIIAVLLAFVPYLLIRGPVARIARRGRVPLQESAK
jgi:hypothetical protein